MRTNTVRLTKKGHGGRRVERYEITEGSAVGQYWSSDGWTGRTMNIRSMRRRIQDRIREGWQVAAAG